MKKYKNDLIFVLILIVIAAVCYIFLHIWNSGTGEYVKITVDGKEEAVLSLREDTTYTVQYDDNINVVEIKNGQVFIDEANCKDELCKKQGKISNNGETIICLPHKVVVTIVSDTENEVDAVAE